MASSKEYQMLFQLSASLNGNFPSTFTAGQKAVSQLQNQINALNKTQADISAYQKQQVALERSKDKLELYERQLERLKNADAETAAEEARLANEIDAKQQQIERAQEAVDKNNAKLSEMGNALREAGVDTNNLSGETERLKNEATQAAEAQKKEAEAAEEAGTSIKEAMEGAAAAIEAIGIAKLFQGLQSALSECTDASAKFETAMAGVQRTVGGDQEFISDLAEKFKQLSTEIPITAGELANIATTAGQLGIAQEKIEQFTEVMAKLGTATDLTADDAATMLAQFANITGTDEYDRLGSAVAALGDSSATTASKVVEMSQGIAAAGTNAGLSETDILAIATAVGSLGIEAASGSTSMSTLISELYKATETGDKLTEFASVAGMSASEFKAAWGTDAVGAMNAFIQGLNDTERNGKSAIVILNDLGITNVRQTKAILGLASSGDLLAKSIDLANSAWEDNTALAEKASIMYGTTESKMTMMQNAANNVKVAIGDALNPAMGTLYDAATSVLQPLSEFIEQNPALVQGVTAFAGVLGVAAGAVAAITAATKLWAAANAALSISMPAIGAIVGIAAAIGVGVTAISAISSASNEASLSLEELGKKAEEATGEMQKAYVAQMRLAYLNNIGDSTRSYAENAKIFEEATATYKKAEAEMGDMGGSTADFKTQLQGIVDTVGQLQNATDEQGNLLYDWDSEEIQAYRKEFELLVAAATGYDIDAYSFAAMGQAISLLGNDTEIATKAMAGLGEAIEAGKNDAQDAESKMQSFIDNTILAIEAGAIDAAQAEQEMRKALQGTGYDASIVDDIMKKVNAAVEEHAEASKEAAEATEALAEAQEMLNSTSEDNVRNMDDVISDIDKLVKSYQDAYKAAKESMEGQFDLFGEAKTVTGKYYGARKYAKNLGDQNKYIEQYTQNYEKALAALQAAEAKLVEGGNEGAAGASKSIISQLADGSAESAQILADLATGSASSIESLVEQYSTLQQTKDTYAKTVAEIETDFTEGMDTLQSELDAAVQNLEFSDQAATAAGISMRAYVDTLAQYIEPAKTKAQAIADAIKQSLAIKFDGSTFHYPPFFASGTDNAPPGFAVVGENGPELVFLRGGEHIMNAGETKALAESAAVNPVTAVANSSGDGGGKVIHVDFNPQYTINGSANAEEIRSVLEEQTLNMKEQIREVLEEIQEDDDRRDYA